jgi:hypothetical protein
MIKRYKLVLNDKGQYQLFHKKWVFGPFKPTDISFLPTELPEPNLIPDVDKWIDNNFKRK